MKPWDEALPLLHEIIERDFRNTEPTKVRFHADAIYGGGGAAGAVQWMERNNTVPLDDIEALKRAAENIRKSAIELRKLGWHGGGAVSTFTHTIQKLNFGSVSVPVQGRSDNIETLAEFLDGFSLNLVKAANEIDQNGGSPLSAFGDERPPGRPRGRPMETQAYFVARECYDAFAALSGSRPTILTARESGVAGGQFLEFVSSIFNALDIDASAEANAKTVCKEKNPKKT